MDFYFVDYSDDQRKTYINSEMQYKSYLEKQIRYNKSFRFRMGWNKSQGKEYLFKECLDTKKRVSLGRKNDKTVAIYEAFNKQKKELKASLKQSKELLLKNEKINKFTKIARVPNVLVNLFRRINELGLDEKVIIIGTNSLYAYEAYAGVFIEEQHLATFDIDVFNKRNKKIAFALKEKLPQKTLKSLLIDVDKSFKKSKEAPYRFVNNDDIVVEIITPISKKEQKTDVFSGVLNLEIAGTKWLENSKLHKQMLIAQNGKCAFVNVIHPLEYAVYKNWLGKHERKDLMKRQRDIKQSLLVTELIQRYIPVIDIEQDLQKIQNMSKSAIKEYKNEILKS
ncbi:nucleotidyltransferase domain-containing protein [Sulfurimonas sp. NW7]|uniref:GSU2403 family nucleotidyltransferase fold protein n=1 Tax=Sulfurimonas sp. NW7 TaxID=2922727 RepID=UPI003DA8982A